MSPALSVIFRWAAALDYPPFQFIRPNHASGSRGFMRVVLHGPLRDGRRPIGSHEVRSAPSALRCPSLREVAGIAQSFKLRDLSTENASPVPHARVRHRSVGSAKNCRQIRAFLSGYDTECPRGARSLRTSQRLPCWHRHLLGRRSVRR
jgi:hypothetical protein